MLAKKAACTAAIRGGKSDFFRSQCKSDLGELPLEMRGKWTARWAARWIQAERSLHDETVRDGSDGGSPRVRFWNWRRMDVDGLDAGQLRDEVRRLRASEGELREDVELLEEDAVEAETQIAALKAKVTGAGDLEALLEDMEEELAQANAELSQRDATVAALRAGSGAGGGAGGGAPPDDELEQALEESEAKLMAAEERVEQQQAELAGRDNEIAMLSVKLADAQAKLAAVSDGQPEPPSENEMALLRTALADAEAAVRTKEVEASEQQQLAAAATRELQESYRVLEQQLEETEQDLELEITKMSEQEQRTLALEAELRTCRAELQDASAAAETGVDELRAQLEQAEEEARAQAQQADAHREKAEALAQDLARAETGPELIAKAEAQVAELRDEVEQTELTARSNQSREALALSRCLDLSQRVEELESHAAQLQVELAQSRKEAHSLREEEASGPSAASVAAAKASASLKARLAGVREWNAFMGSLLSEHDARASQQRTSSSQPRRPQPQPVAAATVEAGIAVRSDAVGSSSAAAFARDVADEAPSSSEIGGDVGVPATAARGTAEGDALATFAYEDSNGDADAKEQQPVRQPVR